MTPKRLRLGPNGRPSMIMGRAITKPVVSIENGYLWIGGDDGPCCFYICGKKTLLKIAAMIREHAR